MHRLRALWMRLRGLAFGRRQDGEFAAELESHVTMHTEDGIRAGLSPEEARRQALLRLGGAELTRQAYRERRTLPWLENLLRDVRYALRGFRRNPVFTITAIVTLALGIGATTAVFSVVDRILFRSLPYAHDDRLVSVGLVQSLEKQEFTLGGFFYEWRDNQKPFSSMTFEQGVNACNLTEANPVPLQCARIAQTFLPTFGISPELGRNFLPEEDLPHSPRVALISDGLWMSRFNRDPNVLNKTIELDDHPVRIVGVLPKDFEMPRLQPTDIVLPAAMDVAAQHTVNSGIGFPMWAFARLKPGVSIAEAKAEMEPLYRHTQQWIPAEFRKEFLLQIRSIHDRQMQDAYTAAWVLLGAVFAVLLIACANVASLFSARGAARERELAVRSALGASRGRLIRQTLTEALVLSVAGATAGCALAEILLRVFIAIAPSGIPFLSTARLDLRMVLFTVLVSLLCAGLCGIMPALERPRASALVARSTNSGAHARLRRVLVVAQIAISVVLLSGGGLLMKSFWNLEQENLGMQTRGVVTVRVPLSEARYTTTQAYMHFYLRAEEALRRLPGVSAVGMSDSLPPDSNSWHSGTRYAEISVAGKPPTPAGTGGTVVIRAVTPEYFRVLQIPMVEGRGFTEEERRLSDHPIILSRMLAARLFADDNPIGKHIQQATYNPYITLGGPVYTVVGVAADVKNAGLAGQDDPEYYRLRRDNGDDWNPHAVILLETSLPASVVAPWVRAQIAQIDSMAPAEIDTLAETVNRLADRPRFETALLGFFALCGLLMAVIGLYGVIAYVAAQRTQEIGVRMALGATRVDILRLIAGEGVRLIVLGGVLGLGAALAAAQMLKSLLFHVGAHDPVSFLAVTLLLAIVALAATVIPARAAMKTDPMQALRTE
ncbi:MAG TPA: ABC transporter permease [Terracidiphilus sp.]|jgi:putative ABC transport system permease protein|nr:ABC transporter permease [Terracidiphilus sp.]